MGKVCFIYSILVGEYISHVQFTKYGARTENNLTRITVERKICGPCVLLDETCRCVEQAMRQLKICSFLLTTAIMSSPKEINFRFTLQHLCIRTRCHGNFKENVNEGERRRRSKWLTSYFSQNRHAYDGSGYGYLYNGFFFCGNLHIYAHVIIAFWFAPSLPATTHLRMSRKIWWWAWLLNTRCLSPFSIDSSLLSFLFVFLWIVAVNEKKRKLRYFRFLF